MAEPALASLVAFEERLGRSLSADEAARAQAALHDVSVLVRAAAGWTTNPSEIPEGAVSVTLAAAIRAFEIPAGVNTLTIGNVTMRFDASGAYLTADEAAQVASASDEATSGASSVEVTVPWSLGPASDYIAVVGQDEPLPFSEP